MLIIGAAAYQPIKDWWTSGSSTTSTSPRSAPPASVCQEVETKTGRAAARTTCRRAPPIPYEDAPPAFGTALQRAGAPASSASSTPPTTAPTSSELVHNLEHGYTILWYDETIADDDDAMDELRGIADKFTDNDNFRNKFKAVPWTSEDGDAVPRRPAHRVHPLVGRRRRRPDGRAGRRLAVLLGAERRGAGARS